MSPPRIPRAPVATCWLCLVLALLAWAGLGLLGWWWFA
jgi:hypothetical protein